MNTTKTLTENAMKMFDLYYRDAGNWSGEPLVGDGGNVTVLGVKEDRGLLTSLKRAGLVKTLVSDGDTFLRFTSAGIELAQQRGLGAWEFPWAIWD